MLNSGKKFPASRDKKNKYSNPALQVKWSVPKIKCTAASDQVLSCQPKIVILDNICHMHSITSKLILCFHQILFPSFPYSGPVDS